MEEVKKTKVCSCCGNEKEITAFPKNSHTKDKVNGWCKNCHDEYMKKYIIENKLKKKKYDVLYNLVHKDKRSDQSRLWYINNREMSLLKAYKRIDKKKGFECDLDIEWIKENITPKECVYCGDKEKLGCDRIDNKLGHLKLNCQPCCPICNYVRQEEFTVEEMLRLGPMIRQIKLDRLKNSPANNINS